MKNSTIRKAWTCFLLALSPLCALSADSSAARFDGQDTLLRPEGYREWVFVGSSLGLRYSQTAEKPVSNGAKHFNNVFINLYAYREFVRTGSFPDGTVFILEILSVETKEEPGLQGSYQKDLISLEAAVKDSKRFSDGWAYFSFTDKSGRLKDKAQPFPRAACYDCHRARGATDHVFTQFYPLLRTPGKR